MAVVTGLVQWRPATVVSGVNVCTLEQAYVTWWVWSLTSLSSCNTVLSLPSITATCNGVSPLSFPLFIFYKPNAHYKYTNTNTPSVVFLKPHPFLYRLVVHKFPRHLTTITSGPPLKWTCWWVWSLQPRDVAVLTTTAYLESRYLGRHDDIEIVSDTHRPTVHDNVTMATHRLTNGLYALASVANEIAVLYDVITMSSPLLAASCTLAMLVHERAAYRGVR